MKVVLLEDVKKVGKKGEIVELSEAYARNVIIKKGLGLEGTATNLNNAKQQQESKEFHTAQATWLSNWKRLKLPFLLRWGKMVRSSVLLLLRMWQML